MAWNWLAGILSFAMLVVISTLIKIVWAEHRRRIIDWGSPELLFFAITSISIVVIMWSIMAIQWFRL